MKLLSYDTPLENRVYHEKALFSSSVLLYMPRVAGSVHVRTSYMTEPKAISFQRKDNMPVRWFQQIPIANI